VLGFFSPIGEMNPSTFEAPIVSGLLEGYQTYDALAGLLTGGVVVISVNNLKGNISFEDKKSILAKSGFIAMSGLFLIYAGLIVVGALFNSQFGNNITRPELLSHLSIKTLGNIGTTFLSVLVALACFSTAVAIIVGTADFFKGLFKESKTAYLITTVISCLIGVLVGQMDVTYIINVALPVLMFIYPLAIVLILLNVIPEKYASIKVFRLVVLVTFIFSVPDFLGFLIPVERLQGIKEIIPLAQHNLGWVLPALATFVLANIISSLRVA